MVRAPSAARPQLSALLKSLTRHSLAQTLSALNSTDSSRSAPRISQLDVGKRPTSTWTLLVKTSRSTPLASLLALHALTEWCLSAASLHLISITPTSMSQSLIRLEAQKLLMICLTTLTLLQLTLLCQGLSMARSLTSQEIPLPRMIHAAKWERCLLLSPMSPLQFQTPPDSFRVLNHSLWLSPLLMAPLQPPAALSLLCQALL